MITAAIIFFLQNPSTASEVGNVTVSGALVLLVSKELMHLLARKNGNGINLTTQIAEQKVVLEDIRDGINKLVLRSDDAVAARAASKSAGI